MREVLKDLEEDCFIRFEKLVENDAQPSYF